MKRRTGEMYCRGSGFSLIQVDGDSVDGVGQLIVFGARSDDRRWSSCGGDARMVCVEGLDRLGCSCDGVCVVCLDSVHGGDWPVTVKLR